MSNSDNIDNHEAVKLEAVYIAARFSRRPEANQLARQLMARGHKVTSRWVKPDTDHVLPTGSSEQAADAERRRFAMEDCDDVRACDWLISLMEEPRSNGRGGRHIEFGMAIGLGKRLSIIGPRETVFHHLDEVEHFETVEELLAAPPRTTPAKLDAPGNQEALAGEGVEPCERCDDSGYAETSSGGIWTGENVRTTQTICDCPCGEDVRRERAEALAGDDRNGVEGLIPYIGREVDRRVDGLVAAILPIYENGKATAADVRDLRAAVDELDSGKIALAALRTPSSPQADVADVERAYTQWQAAPLNLGADPEHHQIIEAAFKGGYHARDRLILRLVGDADEEKRRADSPARPAGGEEVAGAIERVESAIVQVEHRRGESGIVRVHLADAKTLLAALTKPEEGEEAIRARALEEAAKVADDHLSPILRNAADCGTAYNHACREIAAAIRALSSLPVSGEVARVVTWLRAESDKGADKGLAAEKGTTKRAAFGGGSYALWLAADAIERGEHLGGDAAAGEGK